MGAPAKFLFDDDFGRGPEKKVQAEPTIALAEHERQLAAAETAAYRKGCDAAEAQARAEAERRAASAFERIAAGIEGLKNKFTAVEAKLECEAIEVAFAVAGKLAPELIARQPVAEIEAIARDCFAQLLSTPHVVVRVGDAVYEAARAKLEAQAKNSGFEGRLVVLAEPEIAAGDCRIEWADGGTRRERAQIEREIRSVIERYLAGRLPEVTF